MHIFQKEKLNDYQTKIQNYNFNVNYINELLNEIKVHVLLQNLSF